LMMMLARVPDIQFILTSMASASPKRQPRNHPQRAHSRNVPVSPSLNRTVSPTKIRVRQPRVMHGATGMVQQAAAGSRHGAAGSRCSRQVARSSTVPTSTLPRLADLETTWIMPLCPHRGLHHSTVVHPATAERWRHFRHRCVAVPQAVKFFQQPLLSSTIDRGIHRSAPAARLP
jgi:hypothetical protein